MPLSEEEEEEEEEEEDTPTKTGTNLPCGRACSLHHPELGLDQTHGFPALPKAGTQERNQPTNILTRPVLDLLHWPQTQQ